MMVYRLGHSSRISLRTVACCLVGIVAVFLIALPPWTVCSATSTEESPSLADTSEQSNTKYRVSFYSTRLTPEVRYLEERSLLLARCCLLVVARSNNEPGPSSRTRSIDRVPWRHVQMLADNRSPLVHILSKDGEKHDCLLPPPDQPSATEDDPILQELATVRRRTCHSTG